MGAAKALGFLADEFLDSDFLAFAQLAGCSLRTREGYYLPATFRNEPARHCSVVNWLLPNDQSDLMLYQAHNSVISHSCACYALYAQ